MSKLSEFIAAAKEHDDYWVENRKIEFAIEVERALRLAGFTKKELAIRLGTSAAYITKILRGDANLTIDSMVRIARAAHGDLHIHIAPRSASVAWRDVLTSGKSNTTTGECPNVTFNQMKLSHGTTTISAAA